MKKYPVLIICLSQLFGTSLWFSANGSDQALSVLWNATIRDIGWLTSAVQAGFILGTLTLAASGLPDRLKASRTFACCAVVGALANLGFAWLATGVVSGIAYRFVVGLALAGIYPIGMKLVVSWAPDRASTTLGQLVGMLTLGTALPHAMHLLAGDLSWRIVVSASSVLALAAALMVFSLGDGKQAARAAQFRFDGLFAAFRYPGFRSAAIGYFGHMWELYAFWTLVPLFVVQALAQAQVAPTHAAGYSFLIIAAGAPACVLGGALSRRMGSRWVASNALRISGLCCLAFPFISAWASWPLTFAFLLLWGCAVIADSPQFSALCAAACPPQQLGSALAIMNSIGFAISVVSISIATSLAGNWGSHISWLLLAGPVIGLAGFHTVHKQAQA